MDFVDECREKNYWCLEYQGGASYGTFVRGLITKLFFELKLPNLNPKSVDFSDHNVLRNLPDLDKEKVIYEVIDKLSELEPEDFEERQNENYESHIAIDPITNNTFLKNSFSRHRAFQCIFEEIYESIDSLKLDKNKKLKLKNSLSLIIKKIPEFNWYQGRK